MSVKAWLVADSLFVRQAVQHSEVTRQPLLVTLASTVQRAANYLLPAAPENALLYVTLEQSLLLKVLAIMAANI